MNTSFLLFVTHFYCFIIVLYKVLLYLLRIRDELIHYDFGWNVKKWKSVGCSRENAIIKKCVGSTRNKHT